MMFTTILYYLMLVPLLASGQLINRYNCAADGIPVVAVVAGQGPSQPSVEFSVPLFASCADAKIGLPFETGKGLPAKFSSLLASQLTDGDGFTGTNQALKLAGFFPLELVRCVAILSGGIIKQFNSSALTTMSGDGEAVTVQRVFCGR